MPKQKRNSAAKKRFKLTAGGKLLRRHAMRSHNLGKKTQKRKRSFRRAEQVVASDRNDVLSLLGRK